MKGFITAEKAAAMIRDRDAIVLGGFLGYSIADDVLFELEKRYLETGHPEKLMISSVAGIGGDGEKRGFNRFAHAGMVGQLRACHLGFAPGLQHLGGINDYEAYMYPQGVMAHMYRALAGKKPGVLTQVGLKTYADPRVEGCKVNEAAKASDETIVELMNINGEEYLFYPTFNIDFAIIKGTTADEDGNISIEHEGVLLEQFELAAAARNNGGVVIAQVDRLVQRGNINARNVTVPSILVDYVVIGRPENSRQQYFLEEAYNPSISGEYKIPLSEVPPLPLNIRKIIGRRGAFQLKKGNLVNLGVGIPTSVSIVLNEEGQSDQVNFSIESGLTGGVPADGLGTGGGYNPTAMLKQVDCFDFYDGGGIDIAFLGGAEFDADGNCNATKFAGRVMGPGGFINISQFAKTLCFCSAFTAGKSDIRIEDGKLNIIKDGDIIKFKNEIEQISFSGVYSREKGNQKVFYITERAVFELKENGLTLIEIAPGVELQRHILDKMEFEPLISDDLKLMDERIFKEENMNLIIND